MLCPSLDQLEAMLAGRLDDSASAPMEIHVETCERCQEALEKITLDDGSLHKSKLPPVTPTPVDAEDAVVGELKKLPAVQRSGFSGPIFRADASDPSPNVPEIAGYEILGELGRGGMGIVYQARQIQLKRIVALKVMPSWAQAKPDLLERFRREAEAVASLQHPNIVQIHEIGTQNGQPFFSLEYVEGGSLAQHLTGVPHPPRAAAQLVETLAQAIHYAHQRGVIHRDLKPANVLIQGSGVTGQGPGDRVGLMAPDSRPLTPDSCPKITDFGLAKHLDRDTEQTHASAIVGTPTYMAPEQAAGDSARIGPPADVYALGAILYEMLTGRPPFRGESALDTLQLLKSADPVPLRRLEPGTPIDLETICLKCLRKEPAKRYGSAAELAEDLRQYLAGLPIRARPISSLERTWRGCRRNPWVATLATMVALLLLALVASALLANLWLNSERDHVAELERVARQARAEAVENARATAEARAEAAARLRAAYLVQARNDRLAGFAGRRVNGLKLLGMAAELGADRDLRDEATACLALTDIELIQQSNAGPSETIGRVFDANLERYAFSDLEGRIHVRSVADGHELMALPGRGQPAWVLQFSPDGRYLAARHHTRNGKSKEIRIWDLQGPKPQCRVFEAAWDFSPDGRQFAFNLAAGVIVVHDLESGAETKRLPAAFVPVWMAFHPAGDRLAVAAYDESAKPPVLPGVVEVRSLDPDIAEPLWSARREGVVRGVAWNSRGDLLAAAGEDKLVHLWNAAGQNEVALKGHEFPVTGVAFQPGSDLLASIGWDHTLRLWNPWTREQLTVTPADDRIVQFSSDGKRLASHVRSGQFGVWKVHTSTVFETLAGPTGQQSIDFHKDGRWLVTAGSAGVRLWDAHTRRCIHCLTENKTFDGACFHPDGKSILACGLAGVHRWSIHRQLTVPIADGSVDLAEEITHGKGFGIGLAIAQDGQALALAVPDQHATLVLRGDCFREQLWLHGPTNARQTALSSDAQWLACGTWHGDEVRVWNLFTQKYVKTFALKDAQVAFSPSGDWLVAGTRKEYRFWKVGPWTPGLCIPRDNLGAPSPLAFSADGKLLAIAHSEKEARVLDSTTGHAVLSLSAPNRRDIVGLAFAPYGAKLAVVTADQSVQLWDLAHLRHQLAERKLDVERSYVAP